MNEKLKQFAEKSFLNLESFRKTGAGVQTVVWFVERDEKIYVCTLENSGKVKRIRRREDIRIAPCDVSGQLLGTWQPAKAAQVADEALDKLVEKLLEEKYGVIQVKAFLAASSLRGWKYTVLEITPND